MARGALLLVHFFSYKYCHGWFFVLCLFFIIFFKKIEIFYLIIICLHFACIFFSDNPKALLNLIWLNNSIFFGLRGRQDHVNMLWGDIQLKKTSKGKEYLEFNGNFYKQIH